MILQKQPVWEITGAELTKNIVHTADGISVRFPRVTRIRDDKDWSTATTLDQLRVNDLSITTFKFILNVLPLLSSFWKSFYKISEFF